MNSYVLEYIVNVYIEEVLARASQPIGDKDTFFLHEIPVNVFAVGLAALTPLSLLTQMCFLHVFLARSKFQSLQCPHCASVKSIFFALVRIRNHGERRVPSSRSQVSTHSSSVLRTFFCVCFISLHAK